MSTPLTTRFRTLLRRSGWLALFLLLGLIIWQGTLYLADARYEGARTVYLQMPAPDGMTLRWQSESPYAGVVRYGRSPGALLQQATAALSGTVHEVRLSGLQPDTRYWYAVGDGETIAYGGGEEDWFVTAPEPGAARAVRFWVQGDAGRALPTTLAGRDAVLEWIARHPREGLPFLDLWLTTGDNAYRYGRNSEFQQHLFEPYAKLLANIPYVPVHGNHDARRWAFYNIFTFPERGEAGGVPSGSEHFFSFDYGPVHFVILDSHATDRSVGGEMYNWLQRDLAATGQPWLIALFHHPPYSKGSHDSDDAGDSRGRMIEMRENFLPLLEGAGVDLVLSGHSHVYERSYLLDCHYGDSKHLEASMLVDRGMGREPPYRKPAGLTPHGGTVYNVVGSSAYADSGPLNHPAMAVSMRELGSLLVDVEGNSLTARFITPKGEVLDWYRIVKDGALKRQRSCR